VGAPKVVVDQRGKAAPLVGSPEKAWRSAGWFGLLLAVVGLADFALAFYPPAFGTTEWEFGTVASVFAGLPLVTMGFAFILASQLALGNRGLIIATGAVLGVLGLVLGGLLVVFLTDIPVALQASQGDIQLGIKKASAKTVILGVAFSLAYLATAFGAIRHALAGRHR
jgi:hypothetical protein